VDLTVVISAYFFHEDPSGLIDSVHIVSGATPYDSVLKPAIRSLNLAPGLRGEGIDDLHLALIEHLFPLRVSLIGDFVMFPPEAISALYKSEYGVAVHIVG